MATKAMGPMAGWSWLMRAVNLGSHNAKALFGAAALLLVLAMVPTILQLLFMRSASAPSPTVIGGWMVFSMLYSVLVMPPAMAGLLRVIHASETGASTRATALFDGYRQGAGRIIGLVLVLVLIAIAVIAAIIMAFGAQFMSGIVEFMTAAQSMSATGTQAQMPQLPDGFGTAFVLMLVFGLFFNGVYALSVGQVALAGRGIGQALGDGFAGTLKNLLPLLVLLVIALVVGIVAGLALALLMGLLAMIGGLIHPVVAALLLVPVYVLLMLVVYVIAFGVMYFMWRDICMDGAAPAMALRNDQVEL